MSTTASAPLARPGKYLTVVIDQETYGISVLQVREIIRLQKITAVPGLPAYIKGVINLRGRVVPIIELRAKFGLPPELTERTCVVVVQIGAAGSAQAMGLMVDGVDEVINLPAASIGPAPEFGAEVDTRYLLGLAKINDAVRLLLDIDQLLATARNDASLSALELSTVGP